MLGDALAGASLGFHWFREHWLWRRRARITWPGGPRGGRYESIRWNPTGHPGLDGPMPEWELRGLEAIVRRIDRRIEAGRERKTDRRDIRWIIRRLRSSMAAGL